jgi:hypothetical protein
MAFAGLSQVAADNAGDRSLGKTALLPGEHDAATKRVKEGARGGTMGSPTLNGWGYSCRLVDLIPKLL